MDASGTIVGFIVMVIAVIAGAYVYNNFIGKMTSGAGY